MVCFYHQKKYIVDCLFNQQGLSLQAIFLPFYKGTSIMGGKASRDKGQRGEREVCKILGDALGISLDRNLEQTRDGGCDITVNGMWHIEVKFQEKYQVDRWWEQACEQAKGVGKHPVLFFRKSREDWRVIMPYSLTHDPRFFYVHGDLELFVQRVKDD